MTDTTDRRRLAHPLIVREPGFCFGKAAIGYSRVRVNNVVCMAKAGHSIEEILEAYDHLSREQVEAALAYYRELPREIDAGARPVLRAAVYPEGRDVAPARGPRWAGAGSVPPALSSAESQDRG